MTWWQILILCWGSLIIGFVLGAWWVSIKVVGDFHGSG
jgi:hypothetical protein